MYVVRQYDQEFFINTAHEFVGTLDYIRATGKILHSQLMKWREFEGWSQILTQYFERTEMTGIAARYLWSAVVRKNPK